MNHGDQKFLLAVYASTREEELACVPWDEAQKAVFVAQQFAAQTEHYARHYEGMTSDVIEVGGQPAGRLLVARWDREIRIVDISLLPERRGRGVGTQLIAGLQAEAAASGRTLSIHVERFNRARSLYERLGFRYAGEAGVHMLMRWAPPST